MRLEDLIPSSKMQPLEDVRFPSDDDYYNEDIQPSSEIPEYLLNDPEVVGYPDNEMQSQIYDWVLGGIASRSSIKDYGCGRGDFYGYIEKYGYSHHHITYIGYDINPNIINVGRVKYPQCQFWLNDFQNVTAESDYTICIGTLNDNHGQDKWEYFNRTLNNALVNTKVAIIFVLSRNFDNNPNFLDYPFEELFQHLDKNLRFEIDYTKFEDIYKLTVHIGGYN